MIKLDLTGLNCPLPILKIKKFLSSVEPGFVLKVITTDPSSKKDIQDFCQKTGHELLEQIQSDDIITSVIKKYSEL